MNVKRIGTVLMVGLLVFSAMVVLVGTAAAASFWEIQFRGTISGVGAGVLVEIERTEGGYTETWSGVTVGGGHFVTTRQRFNEGNPNTYYLTSGYYKMYITRSGEEREFIGGKSIGLTGAADEPPADRGDIIYPDGDGWFTYVPGTYPNDCYYYYDWQHGEIPEFSTIAIPVASILGLLFFFNRRKHRKE